jgi:hypothetical protein
MKNKGFVGKCKTASGEEAQNLKHEIRNEETEPRRRGGGVRGEHGVKAEMLKC